MRKVVLGLGISLDGYIARPDGAADFLFMPKDYSMGPFFATIDSAVMGRKTYDVSRKKGRRRIRRLENEELRLLPFPAARRARRRHLCQRIPEKFPREAPQTSRKKHLADGRRRTRPRLPQRRPGRRALYRHRSGADRRRHPALGKQILLERPDRPQVRPRPEKTQAQVNAIPFAHSFL